MTRLNTVVCLLLLLFMLGILSASPAGAQTVTATVEGRITDTSGGAVPGATVTAANAATGFSRSDTTKDDGSFRIALLPVGEYTLTVEKAGFAKQAKKITLQIDQIATLDFTIAPGEVTERLVVQEEVGILEPTRSAVSTVITPAQIANLPVNGRQFIDFVLLAPGVSIGDTTSGSTDVIVEPVTKISFASQNIHYNFVAIDGADNMSTASGIQKTTPSQDAVQEFRVINAEYTTVFGRSAAGVVNIITKSGTNEYHGSIYSYFRNDALDARSILHVPGRDTLEQYQFGGTLGGPIIKDKTFFFANYEGQRRTESPFYNSVILSNLSRPGPNNDINDFKANFGLPPENLDVLRDSHGDNLLAKIDHQINPKHNLSTRYFFNDARYTNVSPLNDGFDLPSTFKDNFFLDQSLVGNLTSAFTSSLVNELRLQYARRSFDFPARTTQPHLEVANTFTVGVNRGNPEFYKESRFELVDNVTLLRGRHVLSFGGNFNFVRTTESFPLFYPFEATFACLFAAQCPFSMERGEPFVIFFQRNDAASNFTEPTIDPAIYQGRRISSAVRNQAKGVFDHTYNGFFIQDKIRVTNRLTINAGLRYEWETWPERYVDSDLNNLDPRIGFAYNIGGPWNVVLRGGIGMYHGTIPSPLLSCQEASCGGTLGKYPGRANKQDDLDARVRLFAFASAPFITNLGLTNLLGRPNLLNPAPTTGRYPDAVASSFLECPGGFLSGCGFFGDATIVRFAKDHQAPLSYQGGLSLEFEPLPSFNVSLSYLRVRGLRLGSFYNINQPDPSGQVTVHDSQGRTGTKNTYFCPVAICGPGIPGTRDPRWAVFFEADSLWDSSYNGFFLTVNKRLRKYYAFNLSYTVSDGIDNGPNPSFVLIPQDSKNFRAERAKSADFARHRFTGNAQFQTPHTLNPLARDFLFSFIVTLESPHFFTKFAGLDANGDVFGVNDRVGIEPRNTFKGDSLKAVDFRVARSFPIREKMKLELIAEAFNLFNTLNVRFFNTTYGAADFCPVGGAAACGPGPFFQEGSPNSAYGTPRAVMNPRQIQFAVRFTF
ncbi:MAG TPA: carboxypeptidase regulatory-like domain-containing protein [Candidatus Acidoferrales bacterium]|nr:carboxypeptidase regulatory-like domain-containing protein [Candidatus Acidoferrales bacterium]